MLTSEKIEVLIDQVKALRGHTAPEELDCGFLIYILEDACSFYRDEEGQ